jgi:hypothetical protein
MHYFSTLTFVKLHCLALDSNSNDITFHDIISSADTEAIKEMLKNSIARQHVKSTYLCVVALKNRTQSDAHLLYCEYLQDQKVQTKYINQVVDLIS